MLGADGVLMGTRFYATKEAAGSPEAKDRIVAGEGDGTIRSIIFDIARQNIWPSPYTGRVLNNDFSKKWRGRETELLQRSDEVKRFAEAQNEDDFDTAAVIAGETADLISDIPSAKVVVHRVAKQASALLDGATNRYKIHDRLDLPAIFRPGKPTAMEFWQISIGSEKSSTAPPLSDICG